MVVSGATAQIIKGVFALSVFLVLFNLAFNSFSEQVPSEAERAFETSAERIESFCQNRNSGKSNVLIEVPEGGNITINENEMTGWGGEDGDGGLDQFGPRELECTVVDVVGDDSTLVEGRTRELTKTGEIDEARIRIE